MTMLVIASVIASQYSPGVMARVVENRQPGSAFVGLPENLPFVKGFVAARDCHRLGETIWIRPGGGLWEEHLIVDCAMPPDTDGAYEWMTENNIGIEVSYETAARWGVVGRGVRVDIGKEIPRGLIE